MATSAEVAPSAAAEKRPRAALPCDGGETEELRVRAVVAVEGLDDGHAAALARREGRGEKRGGRLARSEARRPVLRGATCTRNGSRSRKTTALRSRPLRAAHDAAG